MRRRWLEGGWVAGWQALRGAGGGPADARAALCALQSPAPAQCGSGHGPEEVDATAGRRSGCPPARGGGAGWLAPRVKGRRAPFGVIHKA